MDLVLIVWLLGAVLAALAYRNDVHTTRTRALLVVLAAMWPFTTICYLGGKIDTDRALRLTKGGA